VEVKEAVKQIPGFVRVKNNANVWIDVAIDDIRYLSQHKEEVKTTRITFKNGDIIVCNQNVEEVRWSMYMATKFSSTQH
jgi:hypothetical protein